MNKKIRKIVLVGTILAGLAFTLPVNAQKIALSEIEALSSTKAFEKGKAFDKNHWAYKTLQNISKNYSLRTGKSIKNGSISRDEAAVIFVNLIGKIEDQNLKLSEAEKAKIEILQEELGSELEGLEAGLVALQGRVSKLEETDKKLWGFAHGEEFTITGGLQSVFYGNFQTGTDNSVAPNFGLPYSEVAFSGKMHEHLDYKAILV
ncbi:MAG: hypothetical protein KAQ92_03615, partial [Candidatus Aenigmarchaeota archaeon]|nr:hypothetical protein [Candidatus Aenigmarchaeota archaeon]